MSNSTIIMLIIGAVLMVVTAYVLWDEFRDLVDPRGNAESAYRRMGHPNRDARAQAEGLSPWYVAITSLLALAGLLSFFLS